MDFLRPGLCLVGCDTCRISGMVKPQLFAKLTVTDRTKRQIGVVLRCRILLDFPSQPFQSPEIEESRHVGCYHLTRASDRERKRALARQPRTALREALASEDPALK